MPQSLVAEMALRYRECFGEVFRFQVINGTLWVDHISERHGGWYPSQDGEGKVRIVVKTCTLLCMYSPARSGKLRGAEEACEAAGNLAAKGKIPYAILTLMDTLRNHPGQVG